MGENNSPSAHRRCIFQHFVFGPLQPAGKNVSVLWMIAAESDEKKKSLLSYSRWRKGIMDSSVRTKTDSGGEGGEGGGTAESRAQLQQS